MEVEPAGAGGPDALPPLVLLAPPGAGLGDLAHALARVQGLVPGSEPDRVHAPVVHRFNADLLRLAGHDWTCPPARLPDVGMPTDLVVGEQAAIAAGSGRWFLADERSMFTLGAWADALGPLVLVGVVRAQRDHEHILRNEFGLGPAVADDLLGAYATRLCHLHDVLGFPIVDLARPTAASAALAALVRDLGVAVTTVDVDASAGSSDPDGTRDGPDIAHLRTAAEETRTAVAVSPADLHDALRGAPDHPVELTRLAGPLALRRRRAAWQAVPRTLTPTVEVTHTTTRVTGPPVAHEGGHTFQARDLGQVHARLVQARTSLGRAPAAVVLPDVVAWLHGDALGGLFRLLAGHLEGTCLVVVAHDRTGAVDDAAAPRAAAAAREAGLVVVDERSDTEFWRMRLLVPSSASPVRDSAAPEPPAGVTLPDLPALEPPTSDDAALPIDWCAGCIGIRRRPEVRLALRVGDRLRPWARQARTRWRDLRHG